MRGRIPYPIAPGSAAALSINPSSVSDADTFSRKGRRE
jgi:hypothetical protein